ncbi:hypothetical protein VHUM_02238 [Vanrija humicola]|uniref:Uncharacterized protein n=1 Tax=Vanrija humicola TaxID=5417 RepID=A0A7D8V227_VANHU|nr:hypothetical protein VHUM_02238 [Vanrija humicola]
MPAKHDINKVGSESSDFPILPCTRLGAEPIRPDDEARVWPGVQDLQSPLHRLQVEPRRGRPLQEDRNLHHLCQDQRCLSDLLARPRVRPARSGARRGSGAQEPGAIERYQQAILHSEPRSTNGGIGRRTGIRLAGGQRGGSRDAQKPCPNGSPLQA